MAADDLRQKIEKALDAAAAGGVSKLPLYRALAAILVEHTPRSYFLSPSPKQLAGWLSASLCVLEERLGQANVHLLPWGEEGRALLLTNTPDAPFLLDSVQSVLASLDIHFQVVAHPILSIVRHRDGILQLGRLGEGGAQESLIVIEIGRLPADPHGLLQAIVRTLGAVLQVHHDQNTLNGRLEELERSPHMEAWRDFFLWLRSGNFLAFSYRCLHLERRVDDILLREVEDSRAGLTLWPEEPDLRMERSAGHLDPAFRERLFRSENVLVEEVDSRSPILQPDPLTCLGFREPIAEDVWREHQFLGLFSEQSTDELTFNVPALRNRIETALAALAIPKGAYDYRKTVEIFNTFPKVELFFMEPETLLQTIRSFTLLYRHGAVKVIVTRSLSIHGLTLLVIMPKAFYSDENLPRIERYIGRYFNSSTVSSRIVHICADYFSLHISVRPRDDRPRLDCGRLEGGLTRIARPWQLKLRLLLDRAYGEEKGLSLWRKYGGSFSREYRVLIHPRFALRDIASAEKCLGEGCELFDLWGPFSGREPLYRLQFYSSRESYLNELMPLLENLSLNVLDEVDFSIDADGHTLFIKSFSVRAVAGSLGLSGLRGPLLDALSSLRSGTAENDYLNRLLLLTGLSWKEIDVFRGYRNYYFQLGSPFSKKRVAFALINNPKTAALLFRYFEGRFRPEPGWQDPARREEEALSPIRQELVEVLESVVDINEDRILRILFNLIDSTVRTNFFLRRDRADYFFSFKISAIGIIEMPAPRPLFEIYVHSAEMEGIHLRGGKIARGGIRWSDRPDDFRTEILGLMKTQMSKNALIVPVGSKGGFVVKTPWQTREEGAALATKAYTTLMRGLLDLTDNRVGDRVLHPRDVVIYDQQDPYLVVAADKGTAHLSDTANAVSAEYRFWLGDAFASGGSHGYDHKALGITARGAWECVKRHFRELGRDILREPFTVIGIGDMSGDVFGNGMLLSRQIRLLAAFDHRHIFLDPDPDPEIAWVERKRLFEKSRSSWEDYDRRLISEGGGVFSRSAKDIPLSEPMQRWLGVRHASMDGHGLIRLLLAAEADLLWNGGIGTYIKAGTEKHEDVGDRSNDGVRIDAGQLRVKVIGEGGNLGLTQRARIEYALAGGRINTDAIDNSGGVDCSDHEVNLKILMQHLDEKGVLNSLSERDRLLSEVTGEVSAAVVANNYGQSLCLSLDRMRCTGNPESYFELADRLVGAGLLDRQAEFLPAARDVLARKERAFTRPELAILVAYGKMLLYQSLLESDVPDRDWAIDYLQAYFPSVIRTRFAPLLPGHPLGREISATMITNIVVNQAGSPSVVHLARQSGAPLSAVVTTYLTLDRVLGGSDLRTDLFRLDNHLPAERQYSLLLRLEEELSRLTLWALEHGMELEPEKGKIAHLQKQKKGFVQNLAEILPDAEWIAIRGFSRELELAGVSQEAAENLSILSVLHDFLPVVTLVTETGDDIYEVTRAYRDLRDYLGLGGVLFQLEEVKVRDRWDRITRKMLKDTFSSALLRLTRALLRESGGNVEAFTAGRRQPLAAYRGLLEKMQGIAPVNYHPFVLLSKALDLL